MKVLIVGQGGREHAIAWKIAQSPLCEHVFVAPGNGGTHGEPKCENIPIPSTDIPALIQFCTEHKIDLTIIGPEAPLALGIVDHFHQHNLRCFGPTQAAALLETSKAFSKSFMIENNIPTAQHATFTDTPSAVSYLENQSYPIVIKADGLASGKGVIIANSFNRACDTVRDMLEHNTFGSAGSRVVIEEHLDGKELSFIAMIDGETILPFASSQDHKRLNNDNEGPNTGGMGAISPSPICTNEIEQKIMSHVMRPAVDAMNKKGTPFTGFLYAGMMIGKDGEINVLEFNCRLGDPETQPLMMRLKSDLLQLCLAATEKQLHQHTLTWDTRTALAVVMSAGGYPTKYETGEIITGLQNKQTDTKVFHAGTQAKDNNTITSGGRVLAVTSLGESIDTASRTAYESTQMIHWKNCFYRTDIGKKSEKLSLS